MRIGHEARPDHGDDGPAMPARGTDAAFDVDGRVSIDYGVYGAPESYLIDRNGVIRFKQIGPITEDVWQNKILPLAKQLNQ